jgi:DNA replication ATP-dependent helicase Dna2
MSILYPLVIIPKDLSKISTELPLSPVSLKEPHKPIFKEPIKPNKPLEPESGAQILRFWICSIIVVGVFVSVIFGGGNSSEKVLHALPGVIIIFIIIIPFVAIYSIFEHYKNADKKEKEYYQKVKNYTSELTQFEKEKHTYKARFDKEMLEYNNLNYPNYLERLNIREQIIEETFTDSNILSFRKKAVLNFFSTTTTPDKIENKFLTGVSEDFFFQYLITKSENYLKNYSIIENAETERYYVPDIVYYDKNTGILLDIEIDEPYLGSDGTPIHYIGYDDKRNKFFTDNGWIVVRFAESQIVKHPEACYLFLDKLIKGLPELKFDMGFDFIEHVRTWTKDDAHKLAFNRERNKYLNRSLAENMNFETIIEKIEPDIEVLEYDVDDDFPF